MATNLELSASEYVKRKGLSSLTELSVMTGISLSHLRAWYENKPKLFDVVIKGAWLTKNKEYMR